MTCLHDGILRARLDGELGGSELEAVNHHLAACADCGSRFEKLRAETTRTQDLLASLASGESERSPAVAYAQFIAQFGTAPETKASWINRLFAPRWRPAWGLAAAAVAIAVLLGVGPVRLLAQKVLAMLRVQKIAVVSIDPSTLMSGSEPDSRPYKLIDQFFADNVVVTIDPGKPEVVPSVTKAAQLAGYPIRTIGNLGAPQRLEVNGETAFQMTVDRDRVETLLDEIGRSDIQIPESANGALVAVHIPKIVFSMYGDCPVRRRSGDSNPQSRADELPERNMSEIAEAALELVGMSQGEAHSFCQTVDWSSTLVVPVPRDSSSYENVSVDGVEG